MIGIVALTLLTVVKLGFTDAIGRPTPFLTYFSAVLLAAWYGGMTAGVITTVCATVLGYAGFIAAHAVGSVAQVTARVALFFAEGLTISWLVTHLGRARQRVIEVRDSARQADQTLEAALASIGEGITMIEGDGRLVYANETAAALLGYHDAKAMLRDGTDQIFGSFEIRDEDGAPVVLDRLPSRRLLAGEPAGSLVAHFRRPDGGTARWLEIAATAVRDADGTLRRVVTLFRDVTVRRATQEQLRISQAWFSTALRSIGDAVIATDAAGRVTFVNPIAEELTGWTPADAEGLPLHEIFRIMSEDDRSPVASPVDRVLREGVVVGLANHTLLLRRDGSEIAIDDSAAPIRGSDGVLVGVVLVFRDVTPARSEERRRELLALATAELNSSLDYEATLATVARQAVPSVADWCAVDVLDGEVVRRLAVAHVDPAKIEHVRELERAYPPDPHASTGVPQVLRTGQAEWMAAIPAELLEAAARDEHHLQLIRELQLRSYIAVPLRRGNDVFGVITLVMAESRRRYDERDLAFAEALADRASVAIENARLFSEVERARRAAEAANRTKDEFLAMLGHELRNPLAPMLTALELMRMRGDDGGASRAIIERQVRHMVRLVDDLLDVSRITRGRVELARAAVELGEVIEKGLEIASPLIEERGHRVERSVEPGLVVDADPVRMAQVIANLLTNAAKYTEPGGHIRIHANREHGAIVLRVADSGIGIAPDMVARVFDPFVQEPQAIDRAQGGLGLGLTIAQSLVQSHGGTISARSDGPARGSEFVVTLPPGDTGSATAPTAPQSTSPTVTRGRRVLVVDDNEDALELLVEALRMLGHHAHGASDGEQALAVAAEHPPELALLDLGLPVIDGYQLATRLRALPGQGALPVVAITGYGQATDRERTAAAGFVAHLVKPVSLEQIRQVIDDA
ncbi:MAG: PAS domain S-box protein [Deltaproteobacteria bacterium]|nr:PAS domain S-box protein [Nannocystaceae bacterium]